MWWCRPVSRTEDGIEIAIDRERCLGSQNCVRDLPSVFRIDDEGLAVVNEGARAPVDVLITVAGACPSEAIRVDHP
jgi:ferredoxin